MNESQRRKQFEIDSPEQAAVTLCEAWGDAEYHSIDPTRSRSSMCIQPAVVEVAYEYKDDQFHDINVVGRTCVLHSTTIVSQLLIGITNRIYHSIIIRAIRP